MQGIIFCQQVNAVLIHADALPLGVLRQSAVQAAGQAELELPGVILQTVRHRNGYALFQCGLQPDPLSRKSGWQSDWTSDFIRDSQLEKRVAKAASGEIIALGAYREDQNGISIFIVNMEAHPQSNPTLTDQRKYTGIGRMMIAYGIQLSIDSGHGGVVTFAAKTDELYEHYIQDFHAVPIFQPLPGGPKLLMLADEGAQEIFSTYLS